eukprot:2572531-Rhodomonas_salina.1
MKTTSTPMDEYRNTLSKSSPPPPSSSSSSSSSSAPSTSAVTSSTEAPGRSVIGLLSTGHRIAKA